MNKYEQYILKKNWEKINTIAFDLNQISKKI